MNKILLAVVVIVVVIGIGVFLMGRNSSETIVNPSESLNASESPTVSSLQSSTVPSSTVTASPALSPSATQSIKEVTIRYTNNGYVPSTVTVNSGTKVTFINESSTAMWTASGPHPTHTLLPEFDALRGYNTGESYSFTFVKTGTWPFHNHLKPSDHGSVTVK